MITKHRDYMLRSNTYRSTAATLDDGYFFSSSVRVKRDKDDDYHSFWDNRVKPVYEKLLEEGTIVAFGLTVEEISTDKPGGHESWYFTANAEGIDKVKAAFKASWGEEDEEGRRARWTYCNSICYTRSSAPASRGGAFSSMTSQNSICYLPANSLAGGTA